MNHTSHKTFTTAAMTLFILMAVTLPSLAKTVSANLDRASISVGNASLFTVTIKGDNSAQVNLPEIDGLSIQGRGKSTNVQFTNGRMSSSITYRYALIANKEGDYNITPITVESGGETLTVKEVITLKVTKGAQEANPNAPTPNNPKINLKDIAKLEISGLKGHAIVGELIPIEIRAFFKNSPQAQLSGLKSNPSLDSSSFTVKLEDKNPRQGQVKYQGENYYVVIFKAVISPIKAGDFELPFTMDAILRVQPKSPKRTRRRTNRHDPFADSFFDDFFAQSRAIQKEITLISPAFKIKVTEAPSKGKPTGFNGAIGDFKISASAPNKPIRAGDPLTLTVRVSGTGNLSRLRIPGMIDGSGWKTYPAKDHLEGENSLASAGTKVFAQTIIPRNPSVTEIPAMELVYFDPAKGCYQTVRTSPIPIKVLPGRNIVDTPEPSANTESPDKPSGHIPFSSHGWLRKPRLDQTTWLIPSTVGISAFLLTLAGGLAFIRHRNTDERNNNSHTQREIQSSLKHCAAAVQTNDAQAFFHHARQVIQHSWSKKLNIKPDAITTTDLPAGSEARAILEMADTLIFSGETNTKMDLTTWNTRLSAQKVG